MRTVMHIPDAALFEVTTLEDMVGYFSERIGIEYPDVISLPLWDEGGPQLRTNTATPREEKRWRKYDLPSTVSRIRRLYPRTKVYLSLMANLPTADTTLLAIRSQYDNEKNGSCINNPFTQQIITEFVNDARDILSPDGIVLNIVDIHGQSSEENKIEITCFCRYCRESLRDYSGIEYLDFSQPDANKNPLNLVLQDTGTGISYIDLKPSRMKVPELIKQAIIKKHITQDIEDTVEAWAETILKYIEARSRITGQAIGQIRHTLQLRGEIPVVVILNSPHFDWTGGTSLFGVVGEVQEIWMDIADLAPEEVPAGTEIMHLLSKRSTYSADNYFEVVSDQSFLTIYPRRYGIERLKTRIREREERMLQSNAAFVRDQARSVSSFPGISGVVGMPLASKWTQPISLNATRFAENLMVDPMDEPKIKREDFENYLATVNFNVQQGHELSMDLLIAVARKFNIL